METFRKLSYQTGTFKIGMCHDHESLLELSLLAAVIPLQMNLETYYPTDLP